jgi:hypothetical protein
MENIKKLTLVEKIKSAFKISKKPVDGGIKPNRQESATFADSLGSSHSVKVTDAAGKKKQEGEIQAEVKDKIKDDKVKDLDQASAQVKDLLNKKIDTPKIINKPVQVIVKQQSASKSR